MSLFNRRPSKEELPSQRILLRYQLVSSFLETMMKLVNSGSCILIDAIPISELNSAVQQLTDIKDEYINLGRPAEA